MNSILSVHLLIPYVANFGNLCSVPGLIWNTIVTMATSLPPLEIQGTGKRLSLPGEDEHDGRERGGSGGSDGGCRRIGRGSGGQKGRLRSPKDSMIKSHHAHVIESDIHRLSIGSPVPKVQTDDDDNVSFSPTNDASYPAIKVDICERKNKRLSPAAALLTSRSGSDLLYNQSNLLQSRSESDLRAGKNAPSSFPSSSSGMLSACGEGLLTAAREPAGALCSPMVNRRPVRLLPLRHNSANSLQGD